MVQIPLAITKAKLPRSITIQAVSDLSFDLTTATPDAANMALKASKTIGAIEKISIDQTIELHEWRQFDDNLAGQVVEWAPGKELIKLTLDGIILYSGDIIQSFGYDTDADIIDTLIKMTNSFAIRIGERKPNPTGTGELTRSQYFVGCRFEDRPVTIDIGTSDLIKQTCKVSAARLIKSTWQ
jgi:hypothetical protein